MVLVPGALFDMGTDPVEIQPLQQLFGFNRADIFSAEVPKHKVTLSPFYLDKHEVTNAEFKRFIDANSQWRRGRIPAKLHNGNYLKHWNGEDYPPGKANHPVVNVSWYAAVAFCQWAG